MSGQRDFPGFVDTSHEGVVEGSGEAFHAVVRQRQYDAAVARAAELNPSATRNRLTTIASLGKSKGPFCTRCGEQVEAIAEGLCASCQDGDGLTGLVVTDVCSECGGSGIVDVSDEPLEKPLVPPK
jgi:hypothetical protein